QYGLHLDLDAREDLSDLDHHVRMLLFQSIRELLFNVVKHAGVLEAKVTLDEIDGRGRITVSDDGRGFDAKSTMEDVKVAHGLLVVQDRLSLLGCDMIVNSTPGTGTHVVIDVPKERKDI
ncbi:MAG TPA: ATP-binding protein, partial [Anaerolineales bacterium]